MFKKLKEADWKALRPALVAHVVFRARNYGLRSGGEGAELIRGHAAVDIANEVIKRVFEGRRPWNPERGALLPYLKLQADGILDAVFDSAAAKREVLSCRGPGAEEEKGDPVVDKVAASKETPVDERLHADRVIRRIYAAADADPTVQNIVSAVMDGCEAKTRVLAEELNISRDEVTNAMKRLRRRALAEGEG